MRAIFVGNFENDTRQSDLERLFSKFGKVDRVDMKTGMILYNGFCLSLPQCKSRKKVLFFLFGSVKFMLDLILIPAFFLLPFNWNY